MTIIQLNNENNIEKLILKNGKEVIVDIDYGNGLPYKPLLIPALEYGDLIDDKSIAIINITFSENEIDILKNKEIIYTDLHFIDQQFWFDLKTFYLVIQSNDYIYNHIFHKKFAIILNDNKNKVIKTLNFIKKENIQII